jgi:acyl carrier protein
MDSQINVKQYVLDIWGQTLCVENFNADENFFSLGGSSLQAMKIIALIIDRFGLDVAELDMSLLFESPTANLLSQRVENILQATRVAHGDGYPLPEEKRGPEMDSSGS